jgi:hypothetical protein
MEVRAMSKSLFETFQDGWKYGGYPKEFQLGVIEGFLVGYLYGIQLAQLGPARVGFKRHLVRIFGPLPPTLVRQLVEADEATIDHWFECAFDGIALSALFGLSPLDGSRISAGPRRGG